MRGGLAGAWNKRWADHGALLFVGIHPGRDVGVVVQVCGRPRGFNITRLYRPDEPQMSGEQSGLPFLLYERYVATPGSKSDVYGYWLFIIGSLIGFSGVSLFLLFTEGISGALDTGLYIIFLEAAYVVGAIGVPLALLGVVLLLPTRRGGIGVGVTGFVVSLLGVFWFIQVFPTNWPPITRRTVNLAPQVIALYSSGVGVELIGGAILGTLVSGQPAPRPGSADESSDSSDGAPAGNDPDGNPDRKNGTVETGTEGDHRAEAEDARRRGEEAMNTGDYATAVDAYEDAIARYRAVLEDLPADDDRHGTVEASLDQVQTAYEQALQHRERRATVREPLAAAEADLATALREHAKGNATVARVRYRQARDRYDDLLADLDDESLDTSVEVATEAAAQPPLERVAGLEAPLVDRLDAAGLAASEALREADVAELTAIEGIDDETAGRLVAWGHQPTTDGHTVETASDVRPRRELAVWGFQQCR
jgi:hypothetical protein